jgi:hypothetical protein
MALPSVHLLKESIYYYKMIPEKLQSNCGKTHAIFPVMQRSPSPEFFFGGDFLLPNFYMRFTPLG